MSSRSIGRLLGGVALSNHYHAVHGRDRLQVLGADVLITQEFAYDNRGRLNAVGFDDFYVTYGYKANSDLLETTVCRSNLNPILTTTRSWEYGGRLRAISNLVNGVAISSHTYGYDALNRRTAAVLEDGSSWAYDYNDRNELIGARRYTYDARATAGQQFAFDYDNIGNRRRAWCGGDTNGSNLRTIGYAVNNLNQYTRITNSGHLNVLGAALATNAVWVNGQLAQRQGEYFRAELALGNGTGPAWTNVAVASGGRTNGGGVLVPPLEQELVYDADGNLVFDGIWSYQWDGENRLVAMTMTNVSGIPDAQRKRLEFAYDHMNRRVAKVVWTWNGSAFANPVTNRYVYDGWNVLAVLDSRSRTLQSFMWGLDLSGTMDQAGGVGGLLLFQTYSNSGLLSSSFCAYDGNGNITALVNAADKNVAARYEYSPYGELLRATGPLAVANPFRWSTKFWDEESGLAYYGYRYYSPALGRWISRDPVEEDGGINLYGFVANSPLDAIDPLGKTLLDVWLANSEDEAAQAAALQRGATLASRIREAAERFNDAQEILSAIMDVSQGDVSGIYEIFTVIQNQSFAGGLRGARSLARHKENLHHIFPQAEEFRKYFRDADINIDDFMISMTKAHHKILHRGGFHKRGGFWNRAWDEFFATQDPKVWRRLKPGQKQEQIFQFAAKLLGYVSGL